MCSECHYTNCVSSCPNAPEPPVVATCDKCESDICDGDDCFSDGKLYLCKHCVDTMFTADALEYAPNITVEQILELYYYPFK